MAIKYVKLDPNAPDFVQPNEGDAGYDLRANGYYSLSSQEWVEVSTGVAVVIPTGYAGLVRGRSGLAFKEKVFSFHGTFDESYTGEWKLLIKLDANRAHQELYKIEHGDKIAQVVFVPYLSEPTEIVPRYSRRDTARGERGFGSTGK